MNRRTLGPLLALAVCAAPVYAADIRLNAEVPAAGLKAEGERNWKAAVDIYRRALQAKPDQPGLWLRLADIHAAQGQTGEAAKAIASAAKLMPLDPVLQARLSQTYAMSNEPVLALAAARRAVLLDRENVEYLRAQAELAEWNGNAALAEDSYRDLLARLPDDARAERELARLVARSGRLDDAVGLYGRYVARYPNDSAILLDYASAQLYRGNVAEASALLERYRGIAGPTEQYERARAALLVNAGKPERALASVGPLVQKNPQDYDLRLVETLALNAARRPDEARRTLALLTELGPQRPETRGAGLQVNTPLRSALGGVLDSYTDNDSISIVHGKVEGAMALTPGTRVLLSADRWQLDADTGSGLEALDANGDPAGRLDLNGVRLGLRQQLLPNLAAEFAGGVVDGAGSTDIYAFAVDYWADDSVRLRLDGDRDVFRASPRAVSNGIERDTGRLGFQWQPGLITTIVASHTIADFSDGNRSQETLFAPRVAVFRTERHNVDVGVRAQWLRYDENPGTGYYAPEDFQRYWAAVSYYWKVSENSGVGASAGLGPERDRELDSGYRMGHDAYVRGVFGIFRDWQLSAHAAIGGRLESSAASGNRYEGKGFGVELIRRF